jgi:hypothetical protein
MRTKKNCYFFGFLKSKISKNSQLISMDFIIAFVVFIFAISFFFFTIKGAISYENVNLNAPAELIFNRIDNVYPETYDFLDGPIIDREKLDNFILEKQNKSREIYDFIFQDFDNPGLFRKTDYCVYIENRTPEKSEIIRNFGAYSGKNNSITIGDDECGIANKGFEIYRNILPKCEEGEESISLSKPVLFKRNIMNLKILICGQKR